MNKEYIIKSIKKNKAIYKAAVEVDNRINRKLQTSHFARKILCKFTKNREEKKIPISVKEYCDSKGIPRNVLENARVRYEYKAPCFEKSEEDFMPFSTPEIYYSKIQNASILGMTDMIIIEDYILNDRFDFPNSSVMDFCSRNVIEVGDEFILYAHRTEVLKEAISLIGTASNNYYHWCFDILSKMAYVNRFPELKDVPLLIDISVSRHSSYLELLRYVDKYTHPIRYVERGCINLVETLHYFSPCTFSNVYWKKEPHESMPRFVKPRAVIEMYRAALLHSDINVEAFPEKVFLTRGEDKVKRLINEGEVASVLMEHGFKLVDPEKLSIVDQAALFNAAKWIVGDEGAALVNAMYSGENTTVVCIMPEKWNNRQFTTIAHMAGAKCWNLDAEETEVDRYHQLDLNYLKRFISEMCSEE